MISSPQDITGALCRCRLPILWIALTYLIGASIGAILVHAHNSFTFNYRDSLVGRAYQSDPAATSLTQCHWVRAAAADFAGNLLAGAVTSTIMGLSVVLPFPVAAYRGWVGGIVSVDGHHKSRLAEPRECAYYLGAHASTHPLHPRRRGGRPARTRLRVSSQPLDLLLATTLAGPSLDLHLDS